jgi:hypothetical protein
MALNGQDQSPHNFPLRKSIATNSIGDLVRPMPGLLLLIDCSIVRE